jgi:catalase
MADPLAEQAVEAIKDIAGEHPGHRVAHAKGTLCEGTFQATSEAASLTRAPHMQGGAVRATVRFSNGGGDPKIPDYANEGRGMAVKLYLEDGSRTDVVGLNLPCFFVRTPEDFVEFTRARKPVDGPGGQPDMEKMGAWLGAHPEAQTAIQAAVTASPPASYATCAYNSIHAYRWIDADGEVRHVRYRFEPVVGVASLRPEEAKERGADYLQEEIAERLTREPAAFRMIVVLAEEGDPVDDPTVPWPEERKKVVVGRLEVTGLDTEREREGDVLVFDPTRVVDGIELTDDPILNFRPRAYAVSVERRSGAPIPVEFSGA